MFGINILQNIVSTCTEEWHGFRSEEVSYREIVELHNLISNEMQLPNVVVDADDLLKNPGQKIKIITTIFQKEVTICKNDWIYTFISKIFLGGLILNCPETSQVVTCFSVFRPYNVNVSKLALNIFEVISKHIKNMSK